MTFTRSVANRGHSQPLYLIFPSLSFPFLRYADASSQFPSKYDKSSHGVIMSCQPACAHACPLPTSTETSAALSYVVLSTGPDSVLYPHLEPPPPLRDGPGGSEGHRAFQCFNVTFY